MHVTIRKPSKNVMQSGRAKYDVWELTADLETARVPEALMGWTSSEDTNNQIRLKFDTCDEAVAYAEEQGWKYTVLPEQVRKVRARNYSDNFYYSPPGDTDSRKTIHANKGRPPRGGNGRNNRVK